MNFVHRAPLIIMLALVGVACGDHPDGPDPTLITTPVDLVALGRGVVPDRFTAELWVNGATGYTTTWGTRTVNGVQARGDAVKIWDISTSLPILVDSLIVPGATTLGDVQATPDGKYLVVATESAGSIVIYDLADPRRPVLITRFTNSDIANGVHTSEVQAVEGRVYAFLCIDPRGGEPARLVIVDITDAAQPSMVFSKVMGSPFVHDVFVRDGILMTALWDDGIAIFDIGGGSHGGSPSNPVQLGAVSTVDGNAHNIFWYRDPETGSKRYAFVGEEGPGAIPSASAGDIHVIDVSDMTNPREVAFYDVPGAGVHNFSADESRGILYAAFYNGGVRGLDIRGDLGGCPVSQKGSFGRCDLRLMQREVARGLTGIDLPVYVWGVQFTNERVYASDMLNGLWTLTALPLF